MLQVEGTRPLSNADDATQQPVVPRLIFPQGVARISSQLLSGQWVTQNKGLRLLASE